MPFDPNRHTGRLRRFAPAAYRGFAFVHWSMTLKDRATGWLNACHHARIREWLCHALSRHALLCPAYCLMPDHAHFLWVGWREESDQEQAAGLFRCAWNAELRPAGHELERQAFDQVLSERDRQRDAFIDVAGYILENPIRANRVTQRADWPFSGALVPGYPRLTPHRADYWEVFWRIYSEHVARGQPKR